MVVTEIKPRRKGLSALYLDNEEDFYSLDTKLLKEQGVRCGTELTKQDLHTLILLSDERRALEKALYLLTFRDHSRAELVEKLKRAGYSKSAEKTAEKMMDLCLIDDVNYARRKLQDLMSIKHFSMERAKYELIQKGIDRETVEELAEELAVDPADQIRSYIRRKYTIIPEDEKSIKKLVNALMRRGFKYTEIKVALEEESIKLDYPKDDGM